MKNRILSLLLATLMALSLAVPAFAADGNVAEVGDESSLRSALENGGTNIRLTSDIELASYVSIRQDTVLDLGSYTLSLSSSASYPGLLLNVLGGKLTISGNGGKVTSSGTWTTVMVTNDTASLVLENGATIENTSTDETIGAIQIDQGASATIFGTVTSGAGFGILLYRGGASLTVESGAEITSENNFAVMTNGTPDCNDSKITVNGGEITSTNSIAMYLPSKDGTTTINGGTICGGLSGIEIRGGSLTVNNDDTAIKTTYTGETTFTPNGSGATVFGAAIAISSHTHDDDVTVTINGGSFTGPAAVYETNQQDGADGTNTIKIVDGEFDGVIIAESAENFVEGGNFSNSVDPAYLGDSLTVELMKSDSDLPFSYYHSVEEALADAEEGDTVSDLTPIVDDVSVTVTYQAGYEGGAIVNLTEKIEGYTLPEVSKFFERQDYTASGWKATFGSEETVYKEGDSYKLTENVDFTAQWEKEEPEESEVDTSALKEAIAAAEGYKNKADAAIAVAADAIENGDYSDDEKAALQEALDALYKALVDLASAVPEAEGALNDTDQDIIDANTKVLNDIYAAIDEAVAAIEAITGGDDTPPATPAPTPGGNGGGSTTPSTPAPSDPPAVNPPATEPDEDNSPTNPYTDKGSWVQGPGGTWYYSDANGNTVAGWQKDNGKLYYLDPTRSGAMRTGWFQAKGEWYWANSSGAVQSGWIKPKTAWYHMANDYAMDEGLFTDKDGHVYFLNDFTSNRTGWAEGAMLTGWVKLNGDWYYFSKTGDGYMGHMLRGEWVKSSGKWYWLGEDGVMVTSAWVDGGRYWVNADGVWTTSK